MEWGLLDFDRARPLFATLALRFVPHPLVLEYGHKLALRSLLLLAFARR